MRRVRRARRARQGEPGPQYVINAVVLADGALGPATVPAGMDINVTHPATGQYVVEVTGLGNSCPLPIANAFAPTFVFLDGGECGGGRAITTFRMGDGQDHAFGLLAVGSGPVAAARSAAAVEVLPGAD